MIGKSFLGPKARDYKSRISIINIIIIINLRFPVCFSARRQGERFGLPDADPQNHVRRSPMRVNVREAVQISSLKGYQISAQGFNPASGTYRRIGVSAYRVSARGAAGTHE